MIAVLMVGITAVEARRDAEAIRIAVAQTAVAADQGTVALTLSIGVHPASGTPVSFDHAMHQADLSIYRAKVSGRNRVVDAAAA